jgi:sulfatase maturation enzyme AslB (radical SAM superfamily)
MAIRDPQNFVLPFVVLPSEDPRAATAPIQGAGLLILESLAKLAQAITGRHPTFAAYSPTDRMLFRLDIPFSGKKSNDGAPACCCLRQPSRWPRWFSTRLPWRIGKTWLETLLHWTGTSWMGTDKEPFAVFMNASFLISEEPPYPALVEASFANERACSCDPFTGDLYAFALKLRVGNEDHVHGLLRRLTACTTADLHPQGNDQPPQTHLPPARRGPWNSPAMRRSGPARGFRPNDAPPFVNAALEEICFQNELSHPQVPTHDAAALTPALLDCRERSRVPWVFNELLNEIDYRLGAVRPASLPAELHLSLTAHCNLACRFCARPIDLSEDDFVGLQDIRKLDFLSHVRTLRLTSGTGEPTLNPHLPAIIDWIHRNFPHLGLNFFTNGILLDSRDLIPALIQGEVSWINVSLNAATRESWRERCQGDHFDRICRNLRILRDTKLAMHAATPLVHASIVLMRDSVHELPLMPAICRELGIDRLVAFPFFALGFSRPGTYTEEHAYHHARGVYDRLYETTVDRARQFGVSIELPRPLSEKKAGFAVEDRVVHDFAGIERHEWQVGKLLSGFEFPRPEGSFCPFLWRFAAVASGPVGPAGPVARWLYPCVGPLAPVVMAKQLPFEFPGRGEFETLWWNPLLIFLREAQQQAGKCKVCDACRGCDTRQPQVVKKMKDLVAEFAEEHRL